MNHGFHFKLTFTLFSFTVHVSHVDGAVFKGFGWVGLRVEYTLSVRVYCCSIGRISLWVK